jgi:Helix-hairpin-helix motif
MDTDRHAERGRGGKGRRALHAKAGRLGRAVIAWTCGLVTALAYRRREIILVALLALALLAGAGIEAWRGQRPDLAARLETEPPGLAPPISTPGPRPRASVDRAPGPPRGRGGASDRHVASLPRSPRATAAAASLRAIPGSAELREPLTSEPPSPDHPLDLNRATVLDLVRLPGIGPRLADRILRQRDTLGGAFRSSQDLASVRGLGARRAEALRPLVTVPSPRDHPSRDDAADPVPPLVADRDRGRGAEADRPLDEPMAPGSSGPHREPSDDSVRGTADPPALEAHDPASSPSPASEP